MDTGRVAVTNRHQCSHCHTSTAPMLQHPRCLQGAENSRRTGLSWARSSVARLSNCKTGANCSSFCTGRGTLQQATVGFKPGLTVKRFTAMVARLFYAHPRGHWHCQILSTPALWHTANCMTSRQESNASAAQVSAKAATSRKTRLSWAHSSAAQLQKLHETA